MFRDNSLELIFNGYVKIICLYLKKKNHLILVVLITSLKESKASVIVGRKTMEEERKKKAFVTLDYALCTTVVPFNDVMQLFNNNGQLGVKRNGRLLNDCCLVMEIKTLL